MSNQIKLLNNKVFQADANRSILDSALAGGIVLEHSCKTGRCGVCKTKVLSGETKTLLDEASLSADDKKAGFILTCCRAAETAIKLDTEDFGELGKLKAKTLPCRIDQITKLSPDVIEVILRTPPTNRLAYLPGQYVDVIGKDGIRRSYSVANAPLDSGRITLQIRKVENGVMSQYWFNEAKANDLLRMEGPLGTFCLRKTNAKNLVLLATGTGIAPIKAILEQLATTPEKQIFENIYLYWGSRSLEDIYWQPNFPQLPLVFTPVLSRTQDYQGRHGYVQNALLDDRISLSDAVIYACGSEAMINSASVSLKAAGLLPTNFYSDAFVSSN